MKQLIALIALVFTLSALAKSTYYPTSYQQFISKKQFKDEALKKKLFELLSYNHIQKRGKNDELSPSCNGEGKCYSHRSLGYRGARKVLFGKLHLEDGSNGFYVQDVYCRKKITRSQTNIGPNTIPNNNIINCEHTWPQSKFSRSFPKGLQKSDLHHLYPTDSRANSKRGNFEFGDVDGSLGLHNCDGSYFDGDTFEPPTEHKGNVARALFYFSVRYKMPLSSRQEASLKRWHIEDPVDAEEKERNDWIHKIQGNRNPFIDYPELVKQVRDF